MSSRFLASCFENVFTCHVVTASVQVCGSVASLGYWDLPETLKGRKTSKSIVVAQKNLVRSVIKHPKIVNFLLHKLLEALKFLYVKILLPPWTNSTIF